MDNQLKSLMASLRTLANDPNVGSIDWVKGAKLAIWKCICEGLDEAGRDPFLQELRKEATKRH
jgi:hypothetical protein